MKLSQDISSWMKKQVECAGKKGIIVGLSGGIDSSVVAALAKKAVGGSMLGLILPCKSMPLDENLALQLAQKFKIKTKKISLGNMYDGINSLYPEASDIAKANLKARLRMVMLYYIANTMDYLVAGTGNKSELMIGYFTKHGDGGCDMLPLGNLLKTEVRELANELGIPDEIIKRAPTAGLWHGQTDEGEIGMSYECLDEYLRVIGGEEALKVSREGLNRVMAMVRNSGHKRQLPAIFAG